MLTDPKKGLVIQHHSQTVLVEDENTAALITCKTRKKTGRIVCGDRVSWQQTGDREGVVVERLPRRSLLTRPDAHNRPRPLAANIDQMLIVCAPQPAWSRTLIDRYLIAAELMPSEAVIVVNKSDLLAPPERQHMLEALQEFSAIGYPVITTSTRDSHGLEALQHSLPGHTSILVGQSGVGKSSLVNALLPEASARVGELSDSGGFGRHTTTETRLYHLPGGGQLIDSPGVRDFQLWHIESKDLPRGFREFAAYLGQCRFHNCRHRREPGCALQAAADRGEISPRRLESYRSLLESLGEINNATY